MQSGSLAGVCAGASVAAACFGPRVGGRLLLAGASTWAGAKGIKRHVRRGRPQTTLDACRVLGAQQTGDGYPSGHAAVAAVLATLASASTPPPVWPVLWGAAVVTGLGRVYVGAHLPFDVAGGFALGGAIGCSVLAIDARR